MKMFMVFGPALVLIFAAVVAATAVKKASRISARPMPGPRSHLPHRVRVITLLQGILDEDAQVPTLTERHRVEAIELVRDLSEYDHRLRGR